MAGEPTAAGRLGDSGLSGDAGVIGDAAAAELSGEALGLLGETGLSGDAGDAAVLGCRGGVLGEVELRREPARGPGLDGGEMALPWSSPSSMSYSSDMICGGSVGAIDGCRETCPAEEAVSCATADFVCACLGGLVGASSAPPSLSAFGCIDASGAIVG